MRVACLVSSCLVLVAAWAAPAHADTIEETFSLDGGGSQTLSGDTLTVTLADLRVGSTTFDAVLTVGGSANLTQSASGLGVVGGSNPINDGESLTFSLATSNETGGAVEFDGFTGVDLTFFGTDGEQAVFSTDDDLTSAGDNFHVAEGAACDPVDLSGTLPRVFTLFGNDDGGTVSFRVDTVSAQFSEVEAVPEPGSLALVVAGVLGLALRRRREHGP